MSTHNPTEFEVETFSGRFVDVSQPDPSTIDLEDIAHALSQTCRYGGHCRYHYSVAQHAVFVSIRLERKGFPAIVQLAGLHHDDSEAYLGDIPRPMKPLLGYGYEAMSDHMDIAIIEGLKLPLRTVDFHDSRVKDADNWSLFVEARYLLPSQGKGWTEGDQGAAKWGIQDMPSRIVVPDYWKGELSPSEAGKLYLERHQYLIERTPS